MLDITRTSIPLIRLKVKEEQFKKWCKSHKIEGDIEKEYKRLRKLHKLDK